MPNGQPDLTRIFDDIRLIASSMMDAARALEDVSKAATGFTEERIRLAREERGALAGELRTSRDVWRAKQLIGRLEREVGSSRLRDLGVEEKLIQRRQELVKREFEDFAKTLRETLGLTKKQAEELAGVLQRGPEARPKPFMAMTPFEMAGLPAGEVFKRLGVAALGVVTPFLTLAAISRELWQVYKIEVQAHRMSILAMVQMGRGVQVTSSALLGARVVRTEELKQTKLTVLGLLKLGTELFWTSEQIENLGTRSVRAGVPLENLEDFGKTVMTATAITGSSADATTRFFTNLYRRTGASGDQLSKSWDTLRARSYRASERLGSHALSLDEFIEKSNELYDATWLYGVSIQDAGALVEKFNAALKKGTITTEQLANTMLASIKQTPSFLVGITHLIEQSGGKWGEWMKKQMEGVSTPLGRLGRGFEVLQKGGLGMALAAFAGATARRISGPEATPEAFTGAMRLVMKRFGIAPWDVPPETFKELVRFSQMTPEELEEHTVELKDITDKLGPLAELETQAKAIATSSADILKRLERGVKLLRIEAAETLTAGVQPPTTTRALQGAGAPFIVPGALPGMDVSGLVDTLIGIFTELERLKPKADETYKSLAGVKE